MHSLTPGGDSPPPCTPVLRGNPPGHATGQAPELLLSSHAIERCAERDISAADMALVAARPTFRTPQRDGTVRVSGVVAGRQSRWWVELVVRVISSTRWFVLTTWRSGAGAIEVRKAQGRPAARSA